MKSQRKNIILAIFLFSGFWLCQKPAFGFEDRLVIVKVAHESGSNYWIKVFNPTDSNIVISGEKFGLIDEADLERNKGGDKYLNCHGARDKSQEIIFAPGGYVQIVSNPEKFLIKYPENNYPLVSVPINNTHSTEDDIRISADNCAVEKEEADPGVYSDSFILNEILPNPSGSGEEYIEILNNSVERVALAGWILRDASQTGKYVFPAGSFLEGGELGVVFKKDFKFALNDSGTEAVHLFDPNGKEVSTVTYSGAKDGLSYNYNGSRWRWSRFLTPGAENIFDDEPDFKVEKDEKIYKNFPAHFAVKVKHYDKHKTKITWNFGDGHKSYKRETTHKYEKKGKYSGSVKIFNGSEEVIKNFKVEVKSFPQYDVKIIRVVPNPPGSDTEFESITLQNNSQKKINLQNWSIATGDKKLINHPIAQKIYLKPKETLTITRALSKFTLNNKKAKVELRYPTGKVAYDLKYDKKTTGAQEGEVLEKTKLGWVWKNTLPANVSSSFAEASEDRRETSLLAEAPLANQPQILGESDQKQIPDEMWGGQSGAKSRKDFRLFLAQFAYHSLFGETTKINQSGSRPNFDLAGLFF